MPGDPQQAGHLESGPHGLVHLWTTDPKNFWGLANMGMLAAAAFDPVFFAHHANIDRLWSVWSGMAGHANPANDRWLNQQAFYFYDQAQTWIGIVPSQMVDSRKVAVLPVSAPTVAAGRRGRCGGADRPG